MDFHTLNSNKTLDELKTSTNGLTTYQAEQRYSKYGANVLPQKKKKSKLARFLMQFCDIMIIILFIAAFISITVAIVEKTYSDIVDGCIILAIVFLNAIMGFVQEQKAEKEMNALLDMSEPEAEVIRDGERVKIHCHELTVGDIVVLDAGDVIPADLRLVETFNLKCDESSLTGESVSVEKDSNCVCDKNTPLAERKNMAYKGSVVTNGRAIGVVCAIGSQTELGKIATMLSDAEKDITPLQKNIKAVGKIITIIVLLVAVLTFVLELVAKPDGSVITAFLTAVAIAVAAIPESLPAVITIIMSMGVAKLSKKKAIIRRLHTVETLGSTEIICSDKTGTLTQNKMTVVSLYYNNEYIAKAKKANSTEFNMLIKAMTLCNDSVKAHGEFVGDPTETALCVFAEKCGIKKETLEKDYIRIDELSFDSVRKLMTTVNKTKDECYSYTKGAPDVVVSRCSKILLNGEVKPLTKELKSLILSANQKMADDALRVLGFAYSNYNGEILENELVFVGLVGMIDPPRKEAKIAVEKCKKAKMRPIMITGDHMATAYAIAKQIGIANDSSQVMTGADLDKLSDEEYLKVIDNIRVYARVSPENKVRIVQTFKKMGKIVAMTGDGVNDAPSIKNADIGIGMGITGTDVTKEVADMIVSDDNFATIVIAVEEGRRIYSNIKKTVSFLFSANLAEILSLLLATIFFPKLTFLVPVQILFVNLITDSLPAVALGLEPAEKNIMEKAPRKSNKTIFSDGVGVNIVCMGILQTIGVILSFMIGYNLTGNNVVSTTMAFFTLNIIQLFYLLSVRVNISAFCSNPFANKWIWVAIGVACTILVILAFTPVGAILGLTYLSLMQWGVVLGLSLTIFPLSELVKFVIKHIYKEKAE